jgi:hypothetical protein
MSVTVTTHDRLPERSRDEVLTPGALASLGDLQRGSIRAGRRCCAEVGEAWQGGRRDRTYESCSRVALGDDPAPVPTLPAYALLP